MTGWERAVRNFTFSCRYWMERLADAFVTIVARVGGQDPAEALATMHRIRDRKAAQHRGYQLQWENDYQAWLTRRKGKP